MQNFGLESVGRRLLDVYQQVVREFPEEASMQVPIQAGAVSKVPTRFR
jgi:hypothetical protein